jgi:hypothetical protein
MQTRDQQLPSDQEPNRKKAYRKPSVQVYGTLTQMTSGSSSSTPRQADPGAPAPLSPSQRT